MGREETRRGGEEEKDRLGAHEFGNGKKLPLSLPFPFHPHAELPRSELIIIRDVIQLLIPRAPLLL